MNKQQIEEAAINFNEWVRIVTVQKNTEPIYTFRKDGSLKTIEELFKIWYDENYEDSLPSKDIKSLREDVDKELMKFTGSKESHHTIFVNRIMNIFLPHLQSKVNTELPTDRVIKNAFSGIAVETREGKRLNICLRDYGYDVNIDGGKWFHINSESDFQPKETTEAVEFAEWILKNNYRKTVGNKWHNTKGDFEWIMKDFTTEELYQEYLKTK